MKKVRVQIAAKNMVPVVFLADRDQYSSLMKLEVTRRYITANPNSKNTLGVEYKEDLFKLLGKRRSNNLVRLLPVNCSLVDCVIYL